MSRSIFDSETDVGDPILAGSSSYDPGSDAYAIKGGGENMWGVRDSFHFVWTRRSGDFSLTADITFPGVGGHPDRKACLLVRSSLDADSAYVDAALHAAGLTSLQWRENAGANTEQIVANVSSPATLRITRRGDVFWMSWAKRGRSLRPAGGSVKLRLPDPVYVGLGVCSIDDRVLEEAVFSNVRLETLGPPAATARLESTLETMDVVHGLRRVVYTGFEHFEAPNWSRDGRELIVNKEGFIYRIPVGGGEFEPIDIGPLTECNNDHVLSSDGAWLAISARAEQDQKSRVYVIPASGGVPRLITPLAPSYLHGWSPDGATLVYCAARECTNYSTYDVYSVPFAGGSEQRLTFSPQLNDGPEYSPDGQWIYFNSERTDRMQIWRMRPDGTGQQQVTFDRYNNWFAHPSPDGKLLVFISYGGDVEKYLHSANQDVLLRMMHLRRRDVQTLARIFGGQGTINVPSWSPDSQKFAYVSYRLAYDPE